MHMMQRQLREMKHVRHCRKDLRILSVWIHVCFRQKLTYHRNQENIVSGVVKALNSLIEWDWGRYGEATFFVQGAFQNADNNLKTFK